MSKNVVELMQEYFHCKQTIRDIKKQRSAFLTVHKCEEENDCIEMMQEEPMIILCPVCSNRHGWHEEIYTLGHRCSGLLTRVKKLVEKKV